jgi:hypothetical protein
MAVEFLSPADSIHLLRKSGIRLSKIQLSAAIETDGAPVSLARLRDFCDPIYLHQTRIQDPATGLIRRYPDLTQALDAEPSDASAIWRTHFHIPLHATDIAPLRSTALQLDSKFWEAAHRTGVTHYEIESYTFSVLPPSLQAAGLEQSVAREFAWTQNGL